MDGLGDWYFYEIALWLYTGIILRYVTYFSQTGMDLEITYLSLIAVNFIDYHFHLLQ